MGKVPGLASGRVSGVRKMRIQSALWFPAASSALLRTRLGARSCRAPGHLACPVAEPGYTSVTLVAPRSKVQKDGLRAEGPSMFLSLVTWESFFLFF